MVQTQERTFIVCWNAQNDRTGHIKEVSKVVGPDSLSDSKGWEIVGVLKKEGKIKMDCSASPDTLTFANLALLLREQEVQEAVNEGPARADH